MKISRIFTICAVLVSFMLWSGIAFSQDKKSEATDKPVTIGGLLKTAECPLTADQTKTLKDIDISKGREAFSVLYEMFDTKQLDALKKILGTQPARNNRPESPRFLRQIVFFEKAECPLTEKQVEALKAIPMDQGSFQKMTEVYTDKQKAEWEKVFPPRN